MDMAVDKFAIRWVGGVLLPEAGLWTLIFTADDGNRLYLDDELMSENWNDHGMEPVSTTVNLPAGWHPIRLEMYEQGGGGGATFEWEGPNTPRALVPGDHLGAAVTDTPGDPSATVTAVPSETKGTAIVTVAASELAALTLVLTSPGLNDVVLPSSSPTTSYRWSGAVPSGTWTATVTLTDLGGNTTTKTASLTMP
jgi:beta-glucosidase